MVAVFSNAAIGSFQSPGGTPVTFTLSTPFSVAIAVNDQFYIGYNYTYLGGSAKFRVAI